MNDSLQIIYLAISWCIYFFIHSLLATLKFKNWFCNQFPNYASRYRLLYNGISILFLLFPLIFISFDTDYLWQWSGWKSVLVNIFAIFAFMGFIWTLKYYDTKAFLGLTNNIENSKNQSAHFSLSPIHRHIRHPWYFFLLIIIWTRDMNVSMFVTAIIISIYLFLGARLEDKKLKAEFGEQYDIYSNFVPGIIPSFSRFISKSKANEIMNNQKNIKFN